MLGELAQPAALLYIGLAFLKPSDGRRNAELSHPIVMQLMNNNDPVSVKTTSHVIHDTVNASCDLANSGTVLCLPIRVQGKLSAFVAFGKQAHGDAYETDDCDLLSGIAHHVGALLSHATLSQERQASVELEALHRFSAFCLHDLKNLAARLSLIAQNVVNHGRDPAFQESAMRTVADTAKQITALISKLSLKSPQPVFANPPELVDIHALVEEVVAPMRHGAIVPIRVNGGPVGLISGMREQIHQVLLNVVLNAQQAIDQDGSISITIKVLGELVRVTVEDTGKGIPSHLFETLFRPSQSCRTGGLGIGLYQSKQIIEAHRGTVQIRSQEGKGTQVQIEFPLHRASETKTDKLMAGSTVP